MMKDFIDKIVKRTSTQRVGCTARASAPSTRASAPFFTMLLLCLALTSRAQTTVNFTADSTMGDAMVVNGTMDQTNFGSQNQMNVFHQVGQQIPVVFRTFIEYDISSIPENAIVTSATLKLVAQTVNNSVNHPIYIERASESWAEGSITWSNQPDVITGDQLSFSHAQTSSSGPQQFDVTEHVQQMVNHPSLNHGWRIRLQSESASADFGIMYHSSEANNSSKRPVLTVEYVMPIELATTVTHCSAGNDDGEFSVDISGGSGYTLSNMYLYKTIHDTTQRGKATISNYKTTGNLQYSAGTITAENLEPGIYILRVLDDEYYTNSDLRLAFYTHILVGQEGTTTRGILMPNYQYQDNTAIQYDKPTNSNPLDRANTNYHSDASSLILRVADSPNNYEFASLMKYRMDFDDQLQFTKAELQMNAYSQFYRGSSSSNAVNVSLVTENWEESSVTWSTRPAIDSNLTVYIPTTTTIGYENTHNFDTINMMPFVDHWLANPDENYGFELALETYGASQYAQRSYKSTNTNANFIEFEFTVRQPAVAEWDDETNDGALTVNAPSADLPYKYLINTEPIGTLSDVWDELDTTFIDSVDFFTPNINSKVFTFNNLPSGEYHVAVYDASGSKIMDASSVVNTSIDTIYATDIDFTDDNVLSRATGAQGNGSSRLYAELLSSEMWGGLRFEVTTVGETYIGFNKSSQSTATAATDLEFGIKIASGGAYQIIEDNTLLTSSASVTNGDIIDLYREGEDYVVSINGTEVYRDPITTLSDENIGVDFVLADGTGKATIINYWGKLKKRGIAYKMQNLVCGEYTTDITLLQGIDVSISSGTLENVHDLTTITGSVVEGQFKFVDVPVGVYTMTVSYSVPPYGGFPGYSYTIEESIAVGYKVQWENKSGNMDVVGIDGDFAIRTIDPDAGTASANSTNFTVDDYFNWVQFETGVGGVDGEGMEVIYLQNQDGDQAYGLSTVSILGNAILFNGALDGGVGDFVPLDEGSNGVWRIDFDGTVDTYELFYKNNAVPSADLTYAIDNPFYLMIYQAGDAAYINTIASFCNNYPIPDQYVEPKREIEGGYFKVPADDLLRFEFYKEYLANTDLDFVVRDFTGNDVTPPGTLTEAYGDNRFELDVSSLSSGYYLMEIINDKGENWFIRFKVQ